MATPETHPVSIPENVFGAAEEYRDGISTSDNKKVREGAEKMWLAVVQATNNYIVKAEGGEPPRYHAERIYLLRKMGRKDLANGLQTISGNIHGQCFYSGFCDGVDIDMDEACQFIERLTEERGYCRTFREILAGTRP